MRDLRSLLDELDSRGELLHIEEELSPRFEIAAVMRYLDGRSLLFERVEGCGHRVTAGLCGSRSLILSALGVEEGHLYESLLEAVKNPKRCRVGDGPVREVNGELRLSEIPILTHFEADPGPYITAAVLYAKTPDGEVENVSIHRLLVLDDRRLTLRIVPRHLYRIVETAREMGAESIDVSLSIGLHPAVLLAASTSAPYGVSEFDVANALMGGGLRLTECEHVDALAPAGAELVLEGRLRVDEKVMEGPFVDLTGTYDIERRQPVIEVVGAMYREDYLYQALLPSGMEHRLLMGMPKEAKIWEYVRGIAPHVRGVNLTLGGCGWLHCVVSIRKLREGDPKNVLMAIFAAHPSVKHAVVVDEDIDPYNLEEVEWAIATRFRGDEDLLMIPHVRVSSLDPASNQRLELGCKVGIDATRPLSKPERCFKRAEIPLSERVKRLLGRLGCT